MFKHDKGRVPHIDNSSVGSKRGYYKYLFAEWYNYMWIIKKNSNKLNNNFNLDLSKIISIKTEDLLTLYTTVPHVKLNSRL